VQKLISGLKGALEDAEMELQECRAAEQHKKSNGDVESSVAQLAVDGRVSESEAGIVGGLVLVCLGLLGKLLYAKIKDQLADVELSIASKEKNTNNE
jgi:hypothetical protein